MAEYNRKWARYPAGFFALLLFAVLFVFRLGIPEKFLKQGRDIPLFSNASSYGENWLEIRQKGIKIGYLHRRKEKGAYGRRFSEEIFMRINTMGIVQPVTIKTSTNLKPGGEVTSFHFSVASNLFAFKAEGEVKDGQMRVCLNDEKEPRIFELPADIHLAGDLLESSTLAGMANGEEKTFSLFDPVSLSSRRVILKQLGEESLVFAGKTLKARKIVIDFMDMKQIAWVSHNGSVIREEGIMGLVMQAVSQKEAMAGFDETIIPDLVAASAMPVATLLKEPAAIKRLIVKLNGFSAGKFRLDGGRQTFKNGILTVRSEKPFESLIEYDMPGNMQSFLGPAPFIESDSPEIIKKAEDIVKGAGNGRQKAERLVGWVYKNILKKPVISIPDALQTLKNGEGDCNEHAVLLAALARASGLPARIEAGLVYLRGSFFFHAWNSLYIESLGGWITADAALGQFPADVTHLRFAIDSFGSQAELAGVIGRLKIEIVKVER